MTWLATSRLAVVRVGILGKRTCWCWGSWRSYLSLNAGGARRGEQVGEGHYCTLTRLCTA